MINVPHDGHKGIEIHQNGAIPADYVWFLPVLHGKKQSIALLFYFVIFGS